MTNAVKYMQKEVTYGDRSDIGLCTLWSPKSRYESLRDCYGVCGNLYSRHGLNVLMVNMLAHPTLSTLIVTGKDCPEQSRQLGDQIVASSQGGSSDDLVQADFQRHIRVVDARSIPIREQDRLRTLIGGLPVLEKRVDEIRDHTISVMDPVSTYPTNVSGHFFRGNSISDVHKQILRELMMFGYDTPPDKRGHVRRELWQVTSVLKSNTPLRSHPVIYGWDEVVSYGCALWYGDEPGDVTYRYGHTMRVKFGDQIEAVIDKLRSKTESFGALVSLWEPYASLQRDNEPCLTTLQFRVRDGHLHMYSYIRTNDMFRGWSMNVPGLLMLLDFVADELDLRSGELTVTSGSAHVYDYDFEHVERYLKDFRMPGIQLDEKGSFRLYTRDHLFVAEHYYNGDLLQEIARPTKDSLRKAIAPFVSCVDHALWLGAQIERLTTHL